MNKSKRLILLLVFLSSLLSSCATMDRVRMAMDRGPLTFSEHLELAAAYERQGDFPAALGEFKKASLLQLKAPEPYFGMGNVYLKTKELGKAEKNFLKAVGLVPEIGVYYNNLAWVYIETGRFSEARNVAAKGLVLDAKRDYVYLDTLGVVETRVGNYIEAERLLIDAAGRVPPTETEGRRYIYDHLHDLYVESGDSVKAVRIQKTIEDMQKGMAVPVPQYQDNNNDK